MKIALAQINPIVGAISHNAGIIEKNIIQAIVAGCDLVVFPELALIGYPPRDLLDLPELLVRQKKALDRLLQIDAKNLVIVIGGILKNKKGELFNGAYVLLKSKINRFIGKQLLPSYDVFDETRYFVPFDGYQILKIKKQKIGLTICEDIWNLKPFFKKGYAHDPLKEIRKQKVDLLINISASPFELGKEKLRFKLLTGQARKIKAPIVYVNQVGGNDEIIFDGNSLVVNPEGKILLKGASFREDFVVWDTNRAVSQPKAAHNSMEDLSKALTLGLKDYTIKCGFQKVALGISGGIDSALVACLAVKALGREKVLGLIMPSRYTSPESTQDATLLAEKLGIQTRIISIDDIHKTYEASFNQMFEDSDSGTTEENIQARIRGNLLMAVSNKEGYLVLSTGNKSEISVGYCTLYGDMAGGLAVIADVPKTMVYELCRFLNDQAPLIPERIFTKAPTAELKFNQTDQDSLPPYDILDSILKFMIEGQKSEADIIKKGFKKDLVLRIGKMLRASEYKRKQAAPGLKVTSKAFGVGRRFPIACGF